MCSWSLTSSFQTKCKLDSLKSWNYYWLICYLFNNSSVGDEEIWSFAKSFVLADQESVDVSEPRHQEFPWCAERNEAGPEAYS